MKYMTETILVGIGAFLALLPAGMSQDVLVQDPHVGPFRGTGAGDGYSPA